MRHLRDGISAGLALVLKARTPSPLPTVGALIDRRSAQRANPSVRRASIIGSSSAVRPYSRRMRVCTVCVHPQRELVDRSLVTGVSMRNIGERHGLSLGALHRHRHAHLPQTLLQAREAEHQKLADNLAGEVRGLLDRALAILDRAESTGDSRTALLSIREARGLLDLAARLSGDMARAEAEAVAEVAVAARAAQVISDIAAWRKFVEGVALDQSASRPVLESAALGDGESLNSPSRSA
jgi:hypothetical protein